MQWVVDDLVFEVLYILEIVNEISFLDSSIIQLFFGFDTGKNKFFKFSRLTQSKTFMMSEQMPSTRRRLPTRRYTQMITDHCFWTTDSSLTSEVST